MGYIVSGWNEDMHSMEATPANTTHLDVNIEGYNINFRLKRVG